MLDIHIKTLHTIAEFDEFCELQRVIWRLKDYKDCIPNHVQQAVSESGGFVFGAYYKGKMIGSAIILSAYSDDVGRYHHSHMLGVHPDWQHKGIGYLLKNAHYQKALSMGIKKITWTYDPLQSPNANLNITKLGGIVGEYKINVYGELMGESELVSGIPSDRFWLEWHITSQRVKDRMQKEQKAMNRYPQTDIVPVNSLSCSSSNMPRMESFAVKENDTCIFLEIPADFQKIYDTDKDLAQDWRMKTREMFIQCFDSGFSVIDFCKVPAENGHRNFYLLKKRYVLE